jgi:hypothetical protein
MENYQLTIVGLAILATFISFIAIFYTMTGDSTYSNARLTVQPCPDYWRLNKDDGFCYDPNNTISTIQGMDSDCNKLKWATINNISWEGINYGLLKPLNCPVL